MAGAWAWAGRWRLLQGLPPSSETGRGGPPASTNTGLLQARWPACWAWWALGRRALGTSRLWGRPVRPGWGDPWRRGTSPAALAPPLCVTPARMCCCWEGGGLDVGASSAGVTGAWSVWPRGGLGHALHRVAGAPPPRLLWRTAARSLTPHPRLRPTSQMALLRPVHEQHWSPGTGLILGHHQHPTPARGEEELS